MKRAPDPNGSPLFRGDRQRWGWKTPAAVFAASASLFGACVYAPLRRDSFFLYDDFAHLQIVQTHTLLSLFREPLAGMFRPVHFASLWLEFRCFGWDTPGGYIAVTAALHFVNAVLFALVLRLCGESERVAALAATFFLVFPAVSEIHVWQANRGDLLCVTGILLALTLCLFSLRSHVLWKVGSLAAGAALCLLGALLAKEFAVAFPVLLVALCLGRPGRSSVASARRVAVAAGGSLAVIGLFAVIRLRVMPLGSSHYGDAGSLFGGASLARNAWAYVRALWTVPYFEESSLASAAVQATGWMGAIAVVLGVRAARWLSAGALLLSAFAFLAPALWVSVVPGAAVGGHLLYSATLSLALLQALGVAALLSGRRKGRAPGDKGGLVNACGWLLAAGIVLGAVASGNSLSRSFSDAFLLSRSVMRQVEARLDEPALFIRNVPWGFRNGPHVMPCYAFPAYLGRSGTHVPLFRCEGVVVERGWRSTIEWEKRRADMFSQYAEPREDEIPVELDLTVPPMSGR